MKSYLKLISRLVYKSAVFNINMPYYAVAVGRKVDIYPSWSECEAQVKGFSGAKYKKFSTENEARDFIDKNKDSEGSGAIPNAVEENKAKRQKVTVIDSDIHKVKVYKDHTFSVDESGYVIVYTDGSCTNNGKAIAKAGLGVYFGEEHALNISESVSGRATNNCGEIQAATKAIKIAHSMGIDKLLIKTDSQFLINAVTNWMRGWKQHGWISVTGNPVKNKIDFEELDNVLTLITVKWKYVEAHKGIKGNEKADALAREGAAKYVIK